MVCIEPMNLSLLYYTSRLGTEKHINQVSHNTKNKTGKENRQSRPPTNLSRAQLQSTKRNNRKMKKGWKTLSSKK
jgi:hypothetical protein